MKVLILNGSPRANGNTALALKEMEQVFAKNGIECETVQVGNLAIRGCMACGGCAKTGKCVIDDVVNEVAAKFEACDGLVAASPVYYASANATLVALLDRVTEEYQELWKYRNYERGVEKFLTHMQSRREELLALK